MLCRKPFTTPGGLAYGCGQCMPCRVNRRRIWGQRILLEAAQYESNCFATLTYSDDNLPADGSVSILHYQLFLKRLRDRVSPSRFRFYIVGEYGDDSWRPHYHAALFNFPSCAYGWSRYSKRTVDCCYWCDLVRDTWGLGHVFLGTLEGDSAQYICGYVTKKMTQRDDPRLKGREPEFARMSLKPGVGRDAMWEVADTMLRYGLDITQLDVPGGLRFGPTEKPYGRYLRKQLRRMIGRDEKTPQEILDQLAQKMRPLQVAAFNDKADVSFRSQILKENKGRFDRFCSRQRIYKKGRSL